MEDEKYEVANLGYMTIKEMIEGIGNIVYSLEDAILILNSESIDKDNEIEKLNERICELKNELEYKNEEIMDLENEVDSMEEELEEMKRGL